LTAFEKFKIYGEVLKLKGIVFPLFFAAAVFEGNERLFECKTEDKGFKIRKGELKAEPRSGDRNSFTPSPEIVNIKRNRFVSPGKQVLLRKLTPKELIRRRSQLRQKVIGK
jgi:hypothetical protein